MDEDWEEQSLYLNLTKSLNQKQPLTFSVYSAEHSASESDEITITESGSGPGLCQTDSANLFAGLLTLSHCHLKTS